jgi:hypothetical protein
MLTWFHLRASPWYGLIIASFLLHLSTIVQSAMASEEGEVITVLTSSDEEISFTKYIGLGQDDSLPYFSFNITNLGNKTATELRAIPSSLVAAEGSTFSSAPSYVGPQFVEVQGVPTSLGPRDTVTITYTLKKGFLQEVGWNEATYHGKLLLLGKDFEPISLEVTISFKDNPWSYLLFAWIGVGAAVAFGGIYLWFERLSELEASMEDDASIISHINGHIYSINTYRNTISTQAWANILNDYADKRRAIEKYRNKLELEKDAEAVLWFEKIDNFIREEKMFDVPVVHHNLGLNPIAPLNKDSPEYQAYKKGKIREKAKLTLKERRKWVYVLVTSFVASISAVVAEATFPGNVVLNVAVAISIGFVIYRLQDILKALKE